jgi:8-oxo-dGTP diphosphatase
MSFNLRPAARAIILDEDDRVLLCRFDFTASGGPVVWTAPGGGVEPGEGLLEALSRELDEEVGLALTDPLTEAPSHVWHQEVVAEGHATGYDGVINDYFLIRAPAFTPRGSMSDAELAAENVSGMRWWTGAELDAYDGADLFAPRDFPVRLAKLIDGGVPAVPDQMGL